MDERIAWGHITIPERVMAGETVDDWYVLTGKQGEGREGSIQIIIHYAVRTISIVISILHGTYIMKCC